MEKIIRDSIRTIRIKKFRSVFIFFIVLLLLNPLPVRAEWVKSPGPSGNYIPVKPFIPDQGSDKGSPPTLSPEEKNNVESTRDAAMNTANWSPQNADEAQAKRAEFSKQEAQRAGGESQEKLNNKKNKADETKPAEEGSSRSDEPAVKNKPVAPESQLPDDFLKFLTSQNPLKANSEDARSASASAMFGSKQVQHIAAAGPGDRHVNAGTSVTVVDSVQLTNQIKGIWALMNPPEGLHPFLQWWLYKSHVTKEMLEAYQDFSQKRDDLLKRAREDGGRKLRVVLGNKVWPKGFVPPDTDTWELGDVFLVQINNASDSPINAEM